MKKWVVAYTEDRGLTYKTMITEALDYTKAYINVLTKISNDGIIIEVREIK